MAEPVRASSFELADAVRARVYRAYTRLPASQRTALKRTPVLPVLQRLCATGPVRIAGGPPVGMRFAGLQLDDSITYGTVRGCFEPSVQEALRRHVARDSTVYDVGANLGFFALVVARFAGAGGTVHAFEPHPATARGLAANVRLNGLGHVHVHELAVADYDGASTLSDVAEAGWAVLEDRGGHRGRTGSIPVRVTRVDTFARTHAPPDVIKIDTEGFERSVLDGLGPHRPVVIAELHGNNTEVVEWLEGRGYAVMNLDGPEPPIAAGPVHVVAYPPS